MGLKKFKNIFLCFCSCSVVSTTSYGQDPIQPITPSVPFLQVPVTARSSAMGGAEIATSPGRNDFGNGAKLSFLPVGSGLCLGYSPWRSGGERKISISNVNVFTAVDDRYMLSGGLRYFGLGELDLRDESQQALGVFKPNEFAAHLSISGRMGTEFSLGTTLKYIRSNIIPPTVVGVSSAGAVAFDLSSYYQHETSIAGFPGVFSAGLVFSDIGSKLNYDRTSGRSGWLPSKFKLGAGMQMNLDEQNALDVAMDLSKSMVPMASLNASGELNPEPSVLSGLFKAFGDSPRGLKGEMSEIGLAIGTEYSYNQQFSLRAGYHYEHPSQNFFNYFSLGAGLNFQALSIDISYILANKAVNPVGGTMNLSVGYSFGGIKTQNNSARTFDR